MKDALKVLLPYVHEWRSIGIFLEIPELDIEKIYADLRFKYSDNDCLQEMLRKWTTQTDPPPTWHILANAVEPFDPAKAKEIRRVNSS